LEGLCNGKCWYILWPFGIFLKAIWYILWSFGIFYGDLVYFTHSLVCCTKKNLATLTKIRPSKLISIDKLAFLLARRAKNWLYKDASFVIFVDID
jgi:hypothetical protein